MGRLDKLEMRIRQSAVAEEDAHTHSVLAALRRRLEDEEAAYAEALAALDALAGEEVLAQMVRVAREAGTTVVLVTHDATVAAYGDREIVVRDGTLVTASEGVSR